MTETSTYTHQELSARLAEVERERDILRMELDACRHTNSGLHKNKVELAAMVGRLREALSPMADEADFVPPETDEARLLYEMDGAQINELSFFNGEDFAHAKALLSEAPSTALSEIKAEAGRAGYLKGFRDYCSRLWPSEQEFIDGPLADYAQQLRNGGE